MPAGFEPERAGARSVAFEGVSPSTRTRATSEWVAKAPLYVKIGADPIELAVIDYEGQPKSRLGFAVEARDFEKASVRVRFLPCGDKEPTWRGYAGAIFSDADPSCVSVVEQVPGESPSVSQVPLNGECADPPAG